jgi:hypothetical protein
MGGSKSEAFDEALSNQMQEFETPPSNTLHSAIINVMNEVKSIDKAMTIGNGRHAYSGVADKDVKLIIGQSMAKNGLTCFPVDIQPTVTINEWEQEYQGTMNRKQSIFTEVVCKYQITHAESDESIIIAGYGHGVDPQDKSAGKATTYALKNALLYMFLVPTGAIDDTDKTHSNDIKTPQTPVKTPTKTPTKTLPNVTPEQFINAKKFVGSGTPVDKLKLKYLFTTEQETELKELEKTAAK